MPRDADLSAVPLDDLGEHARSAFDCWRRTTVDQRTERLARLRHLIIDEMDAIAGRLSALTGKTPVEAAMTEIVPTVDHLRYLERTAARALAPESRSTPFSHRPGASRVERHPWGWVLVLSPSNVPFHLSAAPLASALAAGNVAVLKPAALSTQIGKMVVDLFHRAGFPLASVTCVPGDGAVGERLVRAGPDFIFLTGGAATGRRVMAAAAERLTPLALELGGKDPMIVFDDANLERAVEGAVYGAFANAGQLCVSVERLYVQEGTHDAFVAALAARVKTLRVGTGMDDDMGALIDPHQKEIIDRHIDDALAKDAVLCSERWSKGNLMGPVVLVNVDHRMAVMTEETFGPVLPVMRFRTEEEAVSLANDSRYGLNASVWTGDIARGRRVASRLAVGCCAVNDVLKNIGNPSLPFGGVKMSGFGRSHGPEGLRTFTREQAVMLHPGRSPREMNWFPYDRSVFEGLRSYLNAFSSGRPWTSKIKGFWGLWGLSGFLRQRAGLRPGPATKSATPKHKS